MAYWDGKVVVVTGGSKGLGLEIVRAFAGAKANVIILARSREGLLVAQEGLQAEGLSTQAEVCDVTCDKQVEFVMNKIANEFGRLDVLVNNVGKSTRTEFVRADVEQFRDLMEINFYSAVRCIQVALPHLIKSKGHVVNIASLSAKTAWPFMTPYTTSKFALAGYTHQCRLEGPSEVHFMLVCPGPIARLDAGQRYRDPNSTLPEIAFQPGAGARIKGLSASKIAARILKGCEGRKAEIIAPWRARLLFLIQAWAPQLGDRMIRWYSRD